ncbi:MAG: rod shape-determining protein [Fusobacteriota bacterium]
MDFKKKFKEEIKKVTNIFSEDVGVDLGTANTLVYVKNKGVVLQEPSVIALDSKTKEIYAVGQEAKDMIGKTPRNLKAIKPLQDGVIADYEVTEKMLQFFLNKTKKRKFFSNPRVIICVPAGVTQVEKRAVMDVAREAGAREAYLIEEPMAAAIGTGLDIFKPEGNMIVDIGGGTTEIAIISLGGIVEKTSLRVAGDTLNNDIISYIRQEYDIVVGEKTAEELKIEIATAMKLEKESTFDIRGRNILNGLPINITLTSNGIKSAIDESVREIIEEIKVILEKAPTELLADIYQKGIVLTGGGALITGLKEKISEELRIPIYVADDPIHSVINGIGKLLEEFPKYERVIISPETDY